jgi:hypothetical protein
MTNLTPQPQKIQLQQVSKDELISYVKFNNLAVLKKVLTRYNVSAIVPYLHTSTLAILKHCTSNKLLSKPQIQNILTAALFSRNKKTVSYLKSLGYKVEIKHLLNVIGKLEELDEKIKSAKLKLHLYYSAEDTIKYNKQLDKVINLKKEYKKTYYACLYTLSEIF